MLIDWFTVGAQLLNFVVLVWLMKHFLYQPVLDAIAAREKRIADQIADAAAKEEQAATERKTFEDKNTAFDQQRASLLDKATADAKAEALRLADEAEKAALELATKHEHALARQAAHLQQTIAGRAAHEVFAVARKTLSDLANADLESRMVGVFTRRLRELHGPASAEAGRRTRPGAQPLRAACRPAGGDPGCDQRVLLGRCAVALRDCERCRLWHRTESRWTDAGLDHCPVPARPAT